MSKLKRGLASALASLLLSAMLPVGALAAEEEPGSIPADEVIFNTGNMEITVGSDPDKESELPYTTFDEEGNYTIELPEEDPFFPYEVQFQYDGETTEEWFETEDDTVEIGGHTFSVSVENGESQRLGFYVGDEYIPARPKAKEFENDPDAGISTASLLPLDKLESVTVDLTDRFPSELKSELKDFSVELLIGSNTVAEDAAVSWKIDNDDYNISGIGQKIDLSEFYLRWKSRLQLELIVGTADPLDPRNKRFDVTIKLNNNLGLLKFKAYDVNGSEIEIYNIIHGSYANTGEAYCGLPVAPSDWTEGNTYLGIGPGECSAVKSLSEQDIQDVKVYEGYYESMADIDLAKPKDITNLVWKQTGKDGYFADYGEHFDSLPRFTVVFRRDGKVADVVPFIVKMNANRSINGGDNLYKDPKTGNGRACVADLYQRSYGDYNSPTIYQMNSANHPADGQYYVELSYDYPDPNVDPSTLIKGAYIGKFEEEKDIPADAENIKEQLFGDASSNGGYKADFSKGITFTVIDTFGTIFHHTVKTIPYEETLPKDEQPRGYDPYFQIGGALKEDGTKLNAYFMKPDDDSYYANGYQTVFLLDGEQNDTVTEEKIRPKYTVYPHETPSVAGADDAPVIIFASHDYEGAEKQFSEQNAIEFQSGKVLHYSAATRDKERLKNYWVTFVTRHEGGAKLFVNAVTNSEHRDSETNIPIREVFLDEQHGYYHDIFVANIGDEELTDLSVELTGAENVQLDEYWRFGGENQVNKLAPFTDFSKESISGETDEEAELKNATKIRLIPTETNGKISGKLTISGKAGGETVSETVMLTGTVRVPTITTESLRPAVRHVPYSTLIQTDNMYGSRDVRFEFVSGQLPGGMAIYPNGELYGAPLATGTFTFTVRATYKNDPAASDEKEFTLVVEDNTNLNVWDETDEEYDVIDTVGETIANESTDEHDYILEQYADQIFLSKGPYDEFVIFWLDGKEMVRGTDYLADEGSTKITVLKQTLEKAGKGSHTIAAEFRENGRERSGTLKTAAQNYRINVDPPKSNNNTNGGGGGHATRPGGGSSGTTSTTGTPTKKPDTSSRPEPEMPFTDVQVNDWFYDNVLWAYQQELMVGMSSSRFGSEESISQATIVTTLARLADIDLSRFENETEPDVEAGQWFTAAAIWAKRSGLLPDRSRFTGNEDISRGQMAVMLAKYLRSVGLGEPENAQPVQFADAAQMTDEEAAAFRVLYARGVFYGVGGNRMEPAGTTTRSQFAALLNRISDVLDER